MQSLGMSIGGVVAGLMCGVAPLVVGINKRRPVLGVVLFLLCLGCGIALGVILAGPVALLTTVALSNLRSRRRRY